MERFRNFILKHEDWLMERVLYYAREQDYVKYTSTLKEAWRLSIVGLSNSILSYIQFNNQVPELGPDDDFVQDPVSTFGVIEAQRHRERGVNLGMFLGLMKYYRQSYNDLINQAEFDLEFRDHCLLLVNRIFDRIEIAFCVEWTNVESSAVGRIKELEFNNRMMTNEKNKYLTAFESLPLPVILLNKENLIENLNNAAALMFFESNIPGAQYYSQQRDRYLEALEADELNNDPTNYFGMKPVEKIFPWISEELLSFISAEAMTQDIAKQIEGKHGEQQIHIKFSRMLDISGKFSGALIIIEDITQQLRAEKAMSESEARFRELFNNMSSGGAVYEPIDAGQDFIFKDFNQAAERIENIKKEEVIARSLIGMFPGAHKFGIVEVLQRVLQTGEPEHFPEAYYQDQRISGWREYYVFRLPSGEIVAVYNDVTERKTLEEELLKAKKLESIGILAGGIAHDFNNLLGIILGNINMAQLDTGHISRAAGFLNEAEKAAMRAKDLTGKFLILSQGGAPVKRPANLSELIREVANRFLSGSNVSSEYTIPKDLWGVEVDAGQITQALGNIIVNAREAIPRGGIIKISAQNLEVDSTSKSSVPFLQAGQYVKVSFTDQGSGIPQENLQKIFDPYFSTKNCFAQKGMGLGLTIAYAIVKKHGGYIGVESEAGVGTTLHVYLPAGQAPGKGRVEKQGN